MAQYYEIVLYTPTVDSVAEPVVAMLDKDGCIMHRLYRDATLYQDGIHIKDLDHLNRNLNKMIVLDDDPKEVQNHPHNLIRVKPYEDATDLDDNTLERITPFLIEIAREGYDDIPSLLYQYHGMDADQIADEQERRLQELYTSRQRSAQRGLGRFAGIGGRNLPDPELPSASDLAGSVSNEPHQLTAKDIVGAAPPSSKSDSGGGITGWMERRSKEKEEAQMRKMEKWNEAMLKRQRERQQ
jgi:mitochondrial import inner membrane translocase subunit TIM50